MGVQLQAGNPLRWSTEDVDPRRALAYWIDTICDRFLELEIEVLARERFRARLEQTELGAATMNLISAESQRVARTRAKIAHSRYSSYCLLQLRSGHMRLLQLGREAHVVAGESVLINGAEPYHLECPEPTTALVLRLPEHWLERWIPHPNHIGARVLGVEGWGGALNAALANLELESYDRLALPQGVVAEQIAALLALAAGPDPGTPRRSELYDQLRQTLRDRLHEPDLSPAGVATQHSISKRSLYYAFARAGKTFTEELMRLRLERAREILSDRRLADLPVSEVAVRCGFSDPSHFARRYRRQFAQGPLESRHGRARAAGSHSRARR
ncbi:MAG: helix-turn-helix domain-containing protein [Steroidobacteraceae bacterium]